MGSDLRGLIATVLVVSLMAVPQALLAQERRGANLIVTRNDGHALSGELIAVRQNSLVFLSPVGKDISVAAADIAKITIAKKSKAGGGFLIGMLVGGIAGGVLGFKGNKGDPDMESTGAVVGALALGALGGLIGLAIGAGAGGDETIEFAALTDAEKSKVLDRLRGMARMRSAQ